MTQDVYEELHASTMTKAIFYFTLLISATANALHLTEATTIAATDESATIAAATEAATIAAATTVATTEDRIQTEACRGGQLLREAITKNSRFLIPPILRFDLLLAILKGGQHIKCI